MAPPSSAKSWAASFQAARLRRVPAAACICGCRPRQPPWARFDFVDVGWEKGGRSPGGLRPPHPISKAGTWSGLSDCVKRPAGGEMGAFATIAQHFSAGSSGKMRAKVPQGPKTCLDARDSAVPAGLDSSPHRYPSTEVLGYFLPRLTFFTVSKPARCSRRHAECGCDALVAEGAGRRLVASTRRTKRCGHGPRGEVPRTPSLRRGRRSHAAAHFRAANCIVPAQALVGSEGFEPPTNSV